METVRATLRTVSRTGHSHAESMCAWPTAEMRWAPSYAGRASTAASSPRAALAVAGDVAEVERVEGLLQGQQDLDLARVVLAQLGGELVEHLDVGEQLPHLGVDVDDGGGSSR